MVEALATTALSAGVLLLENGLACSNLLLAGSWRASLSRLRQAVAQIGAQRRRILSTILDLGVVEFLRYVVRAAFDAGAAAGAIIFIGRGDGRTGAERQRAREKYSKSL